MNENEISRIVVDCALNIHKELGPGLLESVYELLLTHELESCGLKVACQVPVKISYKGICFDKALELTCWLKIRLFLSSNL